jgi:4-hydroxythreonine-4-phosphate dehydrogenase
MKNSSVPVPIAITMGDPAGVGPEVVVRALASKEVAHRVLPVVVGSVRTLERAARLTGVELQFLELDADGRARGTLRTRGAGRESRRIAVVTPGGMTRGSSARARGQTAFACVKEAVRLCSVGRTRGIVTAPISKATLGAAGLRFAGHTEMLQRLCGSRRTVMMFASDELRVSLVTTHTPVGRLTRELTRVGLEEVIAMTKKAMTMLFGTARPRLAVLALNPHAGEAGFLGLEEESVIRPAMRSARKNGVLVEGPFPADSFFSRGKWRDFDATIAMYHDQALIPAKLLAGDRVVNLTLGLPFVRTSPGHGTAEDLAWQGRALAEGMVSAILLAADLSQKVRLPLRWD